MSEKTRRVVRRQTVCGTTLGRDETACREEQAFIRLEAGDELSRPGQRIRRYPCIDLDRRGLLWFESRVQRCWWKTAWRGATLERASQEGFRMSGDRRLRELVRLAPPPNDRAGIRHQP